MDEKQTKIQIGKTKEKTERGPLASMALLVIAAFLMLCIVKNKAAIENLKHDSAAMKFVYDMENIFFYTIDYKGKIVSRVKSIYHPTIEDFKELGIPENYWSTGDRFTYSLPKDTLL